MVKRRGKHLSMHMAAPSTIAEIAKENLPPQNEKGDILKFGSECFDAGIIEILKQIANSEINKRDFLKSKYTRERLVETKEKYQTLLNTFNERERTLIKDFDDSWNDYRTAEAYDCYVEGFIDGYRWLKSYIEHNKGAM
jgi:hypothetical protein